MLTIKAQIVKERLSARYQDDVLKNIKQNISIRQVLLCSSLDDSPLTVWSLDFLLFKVLEY